MNAGMPAECSLMRAAETRKALRGGALGSLCSPIVPHRSLACLLALVDDWVGVDELRHESYVLRG